MDLTTAQTDAAKADQAVNDAEQAVKDAQAVVDGTNADQIKADAQNAQAKANQAQANLTAAVKDANQAHQDLTAAKDTADQAQKALTNAQATASQTQTALNSAQATVKDAQTKVDQINDQLNSINTIVLPEGYQDSDEAALTGLDINHYKDIEADKNVTVDPLHLTNEQQKELTLWIASILNGAHKQLGDKVGYKNMNVVTADSLNYAKIVADNYWDKFDHDLSALKKAQDSVGGTQFRSESIGWGYIPTGTTSLNDLKRGVYNFMLSMIFEDADSDWGHAQQLLGFDLASVGDPAENYFGFSIDKNGILHFENYVPWDDTSEKYEVPSNNTTELQNQLKVATQDLTAKQNDLATKQAANNQATQAVKDAQADLTQANQAVKGAQAKVTQADNNVSDLKSQLQTAQDQAKQAQALVDQLNASMPAKLAALDQAKTDLAAKQSAAKAAHDTVAAKQAALDQATQAVKDAKAKLAQATQAVKDAQTKLDNLKQQLALLEHADEKLAQAQADLKQAEADLAAAKAAQTQAQADYDVAYAKAAAAQAKLDAAKAVLAKYQEHDRLVQAVKDAEAKAQQEAADKAARTPFYQVAGQLFDGQGKPVTGYTVKNGQVFDEKGNLVGVLKDINSRAVKKVVQANSAVLPQTGTKEGNFTLFGSLALALAGFLGLAGVDRKFKRPLVK